MENEIEISQVYELGFDDAFSDDVLDGDLIYYAAWQKDDLFLYCEHIDTPTGIEYRWHFVTENDDNRIPVSTMDEVKAFLTSRKK